MHSGDIFHDNTTVAEFSHQMTRQGPSLRTNSTIGIDSNKQDSKGGDQMNILCKGPIERSEEGNIRPNFLP